MKSSVTYSKLSTLCKVQNGYAFDSKLFTSDSNDMPLVRIRDIKTGQTETFYKGNYSQEYVLHNGDYIIGMDGEFNITEWQGGDALLNQRVCRIIVSSNKLLPKYVLYFLPIPLRKIEDETPFVTVKHLSSKKLNDIIIPVPSIEEQQRIVDELDLLTGIIDKKNAQLRDLDSLVDSLFYEMFGEAEVNQKGFPLLTVDDVIQFQGGSQPDKKCFEYEPTEDNVRLIQIRDYKTDRYITYVPKELARRFCTEDDIMIGRYGPPIFQILKGISGAYNVALMKAVPKQGNKDFIRVFLKQKRLLHYLESFSRRVAGQDGIQMDKLRAYPFPFPPMELQNRFAKQYHEIEKQKQVVSQSMAECESLLSSRMSHYFG